MEEQMADGNPMTKEMVEAAERSAGNGMSGLSYSIAANTLIRTWAYGPELQSILYPVT
jgi:hypothetical protein